MIRQTAFEPLPASVSFGFLFPLIIAWLVAGFEGVPPWGKEP